MTKRVANWLVPTLLVVACCLPRPAWAGGNLEQRIQDVMNEAIYKHAQWGILVVHGRSGKVLYEWNADKLFAPASTTKLFSVAAALDTLGADYRFQTPVLRRGNLDDAGELHGDLILVASGDLTMGGRTGSDGHIAFKDSDHTYANGGESAELTEPDPLGGLNELARQIAARGVKRVRGDVLVDDRLFDKAESTGSGPSRLSPVLINDNLIDFVITPTTCGSLATVHWRPETVAYRVDAVVDTVAKGAETRVQVSSGGSDRIIVRGQIAEGHRPLVRVFEVENATSFARTLLIESLVRAGITVDASPLLPNRSDRLPPRDQMGLESLAVLSSPPFSENVKLILKVSHNLHASTLPLLVASREGKRSLTEGLRLQGQFLGRAGVDVDTISFGGGAGGSRADYTTPRATVQLLKHMAGRPDFAVYESALPVLGIDGTLASATAPGSPARGHVHAKTGTLFWENTMNNRFVLTSKALAGYMSSAAGEPIVFAMFVNNTHLDRASDTTREGKTLGKLCEILFEDL